MPINTYNVALWRQLPRETQLPYWADNVQASDPLQAVLFTMSTCQLEKVAHAAAHLVGTSEITRYQDVELYIDDEGNLKGGYLDDETV
ncbi:hypothetical protein KSC_046050 [Ktedonobacter sp. SOSP1-52]|uniref:hypothetical protein n=1 Tax=Ktedonobacter sp. SOSP1-52 TaxID=2778366 RepID=UPI001915179D|nr:hypothetical protein [Ktedonobacter sp. SOSP1-52]GHO65713.1 hypothetical protein KSC_046050 [Ktedonobacter sp. SOSP1-52]